MTNHIDSRQFSVNKNPGRKVNEEEGIGTD
jgi:hypothetical protein